MNLQHLGNRIRARREKLAVKKQEKTRFLGVAEHVCVQELELVIPRK